MKNYNLALSLAVMLLILTGCGKEVVKPETTADGTPLQPGVSVREPNIANAIKVDMTNSAFAPAIVTIKAGDTISWTNRDKVMHQLKSETFNSQELQTGQTFSFTFDNPGTYDYVCSVHPSMTGSIIVQ